VALLKQVKGVVTLIALTYILTLEDPRRFRKSRDAGCYTHRVAISNHRLVAFENDRVSFRWRDYAHGGKKKIMTVSAHEFLRRFLLHVLPGGLVPIRHFGLFANRRRVRCAPTLPHSAQHDDMYRPARVARYALSSLFRRHAGRRTTNPRPALLRLMRDSGQATEVSR
jgi:hypothetical protein